MSLGWIALLYAVGVGLLFMELFTPGVVLGLSGIACLGVSVYFLFAGHGAVAGTTGLGVSVAIVAAIATFAVRRLTARDVQDSVRFSIADPALSSLVGEEGFAASTLRPAGIARFGERRLDVVTRGEMVEAGARVKVIEVEGNRIVVREVVPDQAKPSGGTRPQEPGAHADC